MQKSVVRRIPRVYTPAFMMPPRFGGWGKQYDCTVIAKVARAEPAIFGVSCSDGGTWWELAGSVPPYPLFELFLCPGVTDNSNNRDNRQK